MAYFTHNDQNSAPHERVFHQPVQDDWADNPEDDYDDAMDDDGSYPQEPYEDGYDEDYPDDEPLTPEEKKMLRKGRFRVAAGIFDFFSVIAGTVVILIFIALLVSLITWLQSDFDQTFTLITRTFG